MSFYRLYFIVILFAFLNCSSFIKSEELTSLKSLEKKNFLMKIDVSVGGRILKKNQKIGLVVTEGDGWIKVEGYLAEIGKLKADRVRLLYLFEEDFPDEKFDMKIFEEKLFSIIKEI